MVFVNATSTKDFTLRKMMGLKLEFKPVLLVNFKDKYYAIVNRCTHMVCILSDGTLRKYLIKYHYHKSSFNIRTEKVAKRPAQEPEASLNVKLKGNQILINI
jgi:3-phenylpropionate/trans-cinnamate dioxygenase ferredoxin subunit